MLARLARLFGRGRSAQADFTVSSGGPAGDADGGALIRLRGVDRAFGRGVSRNIALQGVDLEIERGEFIGVDGPSGSGKTTLLSILGLLDTPTAGSYLLNGRAVEEMPASQRARTRNREIGFIFQSFNLIGDMTAFENVDLPLSYLGLPGGERRDRVTEALERVGMAAKAGSYPSQLSGGHQQRVAVARAVVGGPQILLADEPTGNLNSDQASVVIQMLAELHEAGSTICLVTHDPRWREVTRRTVHLFDGRVVEPAAGAAEPVS
ncbi:MAG TPA: ABC transporter ATP-binding protein [Acidobacteriota bacterium]|nr:ABC transporter ATP-binding protein [Acidobacteriota bacterium]